MQATGARTLRRRLVERELLDLPGPIRSEIEGNLRDIEAANRWLGGTAVILGHLTRLIGPEPSRQPIRILDVATGLADIPAAIVRWARRHSIAVCITAVDKNPTVVEFAREYTRPYPEIAIFQQDALQPACEDGSYDFVTCSQVIHHLTTDEVIRLLRSANRIALQGIVVSDLRRRTLCAVTANLGSPLIRNRLSRHDARVSFLNAFTPAELREIGREAGLLCPTLYLHGPCRVAMVVDKRTCVRREVTERRRADDSAFGLMLA